MLWKCFILITLSQFTRTSLWSKQFQKSMNSMTQMRNWQKIYRFFNFDIRWWVGPSTSKNHGINFPPPLSFRKIKVFEKFFGKILSPENGHKNFDLHFLSSTAPVVDFLYLIWKIWTQGFRACVFYCWDSAGCWELANNVVLSKSWAAKNAQVLFCWEASHFDRGELLHKLRSKPQVIFCLSWEKCI